MIVPRRILAMVLLLMFAFISCAAAAVANPNQAVFPLAPAKLTVTHPMGGEVWQAMTSHMITWTYSGHVPGPSLDLYLLKGDKVADFVQVNIPVGVNGHGSYEYLIPHSMAPGDGYRIKMISTATTAAGKKFFGVSAPFRIAPKPELALVEPKADAVWQSGKVHRFAWKYTGDPGTQISIRLVYATLINPIVVGTFPIGANGSGYCDWKVPSGLKGHYQVSLATHPLNLQFVGPPFKIVDAPQPTIDKDLNFFKPKPDPHLDPQPEPPAPK